MEQTTETKETVSIQETLKEREKTHGKYKDVAGLFHALKGVILIRRTCYLYNDEELASLDMILMKLARILSGGEHSDSWHDIAGYALLAEESLTEQTKPTKPTE